MKPQRQDSLRDQLRDLLVLTRNEGMYDAYDWVEARIVDARVGTDMITRDQAIAQRDAVMDDNERCDVCRWPRPRMI